MGDRGNIVINYSNGSEIYFYSHWSGYDLFNTLQNALSRGRDRWNDEPYLARIIFCEMVKEDLNDNTGFGISPDMCDNEYPILVVSPADQSVRVRTESGSDVEEWTFDEFLELKNDPRNEDNR